MPSSERGMQPRRRKHQVSAQARKAMPMPMPMPINTTPRRRGDVNYYVTPWCHPRCRALVAAGLKVSDGIKKGLTRWLKKTSLKTTRRPTPARTQFPTTVEAAGTSRRGAVSTKFMQGQALCELPLLLPRLCGRTVAEVPQLHLVQRRELVT